MQPLTPDEPDRLTRGMDRLHTKMFDRLRRQDVTRFPYWGQNPACRPG
ncbi:hypothetical protein BZL29_3445 [Mycobacterium kansasii]|uniref:Uncharacterized protein n=1 Tax=Mycobacterium kansasii TaxID=1768 RepID=A0A1V3XCL6_MYCKA|nr:hypothetical protein BZL29_3445 [Mycobacterium kansasii]